MATKAEEFIMSWADNKSAFSELGRRIASRKFPDELIKEALLGVMEDLEKFFDMVEARERLE